MSTIYISRKDGKTVGYIAGPEPQAVFEQDFKPIGWIRITREAFIKMRVGIFAQDKNRANDQREADK